jgi:predicted CXXCH cytochrome family protein
MHSLRGAWIAPGACAALFAALVAAAGFAGTSKPARSTAPPSFPASLWAKAAPDDYLGPETCAGCHPEWKASLAKTPHALYVGDPKLPKDRQGCEACHGPGKGHVDNLGDDVRRSHIMSFSPERAAEASQACMRCHSSTMRTSEWHRTAHARANVSCVSCHKIHQEEPGAAASQVAQRKPRDPMTPIFAARPDPHRLLIADEATLCGNCHRRELNDFRGMSHHPLAEGRIVCSDCHEVHPDRQTVRRGAGSTRMRNDHEVSREVCVTCHAETAGPFAYEHDPAAGYAGEGCSECHKPHGSHNPRLLTTFSRGVCNQCHTDMAATHYPGRSCWDAVGCHIAIHGSNTDKNLLKY